ncbi:OmpL47-type beta-barrel domain-containing protein [Paenibacillus sp. HJGM_3]|uniref:OmpL47-type beta-barrel domain-containing protein n=1 Tax=Paenibacillus sp. HJGM_3 TaxID=3379816 RepID=UPI00385FE514
MILRRINSKIALLMALLLSIQLMLQFSPGPLSNTAYADPVTVVAAPPVPAYTHPRILITPNELPALKERLTDSAIGRRSMQSMRAWIDHHVTNATKLKPLYEALVAGDANTLATFPASYASYLLLVLNYEAFYTLVTDDAAKGAELSKALVSTVRILGGTISNPSLKSAMGAELYNLGYCYDFIYNYMTEAQRTEVRDFISSTTLGKVLPVTTNPDPRINRDNIAPVTTQWGLLALAIEGETGYDPNVYTQSVQAMNEYLNHGVFETGAATEDMHYVNYGMSFGAQALIAMAKRGDSLYNNPGFQNMKNWYVNSIEPYGYKFTTLGDTTNDLGGLLPNYVLMKWLNPDDPVVDFIWRNRVRDDYTGIKYRNDFLMAAMFGLDWTGGENTEKAPVADDWGVDTSSNPPIVTLKPYNPAALQLPVSFLDSNRGLYITRNEWSTDAMVMHFETNTDSFGPSHTHSNATDFTLTALGQKWVIDRGYHIYESNNHNNISIDGKGQGFFGAYGKTEGVLDGGLGTVFVGNAKNAYDYKYTFKSRLNNPENKGYTWEFEPKSLWPSSSANSTWRASYNPVEKAFRSAMMLRGAYPYALVLDDIQKDANQHLYEWFMQIPNNVESKGVTGPDMTLGLVDETSSTPRMLIRSLTATTGTPRVDTFDVRNSPETGSYQNETFGTGKKVVIPTQSANPGFKTLLFPHNQGMALPSTTMQGSSLTVSWPGQKDVYTFSSRTDGRTAYGMVRNDGQAFLMVGLTSYNPTGAMSVVAEQDGANVLYESNTVTVYGSDWKKLTVNVPGVVQVKVLDDQGNPKDMTGLIQYTPGGVIITEQSTPDTQAPTAPANLTATAVSSSEIQLSWAASTDNKGVVGYKVYRGGEEVGTTTVTEYSDTGLTPSTTYSYTVKAYDAANNLSPVSNTASTATSGVPVTVFSDNFESGTLNGWTIANGTWANVVDGANRTLKKTSSAEGIIVAGDDWSDITYTGKINVPQTGTNAGLVFRYADVNNFYHFRIYAGNAELYKKVGGTMTKVAGTASNMSVNQWHTFKVIVTGNNIKGYIDDVLQLDWTNSINELASGKIGFRSASNPSPMFDDAQVTTQSAPNPPIQKVASIRVTGVNEATYMNRLGSTLQMLAAVAPQDAADKSVTWSIRGIDGAAADAASISNTGLLTARKDGIVRVIAAANDGSGVRGEVNVTIDSLAPVTTATVLPAQPDGQNGWYTDNVTVSLAAEDPLTGVARTEISLDGGAVWQAYMAPVTIDQDGSYSVLYRSVDKAGNVEAAHTIPIRLDSHAPDISISLPAGGSSLSDSGDITLQFTATDDQSGVDSSKTTVTLNGRTIRHDATILLYTLTLGSHTLSITTADLAGNTKSMSSTFQTVTSVDALKELVTRFIGENRIDNPGIANSLMMKLENNNLESFIHEVEAQSGKHISSESADYLLRDARFLHNRSK